VLEAFSPRVYMRNLKLPFCPGCGYYSLNDTFLRAVHELGHESLGGFCFVSGIGCASWIPSPYYLADSVHTLHGRSIPVATSIKLVRPDLDVVVFGGDGDIVGIGMSHFIHAARRNTDILVIMGNNRVYGMTGGQVAPTTPLNSLTTTTPYGSFEHPVDAVKLAMAAGATFSARWTTAQPRELKDSIKKGIRNKGFRFIEVVSQCPVGYGRRVGIGGAADILRYFKEQTVSVEGSVGMSAEDLDARIVTGEFMGRIRPTLVETVSGVLKKGMEETGPNGD
jgi:2-oxoglutarate ferredoxin oxidoreductase subunit beta